MEEGQVERGLRLARRQQCACIIQELGSRLQTTQVVINAGIYYMHHFYEVFSPETIKPILVAIASFYCACKTEDFSRKLAFIIKATYEILKRPVPNESSDTFKRLVQNIHALEATILMVIGFQTLEVKQPHVLLINAIRANKFPKEISHTSYYICTNILHLTTLILKHSAEAIAAASLYIAAKWNSSDIQSANGEWYHIFSPTLTFDEIAKITDEFTTAFQACDMKIKEQLRTSLRSRKLQREQKDESMISRTQELYKKPVADSTPSLKPSPWKQPQPQQSEKRPYSAVVGSGVSHSASMNQSAQHSRQSHPVNSQGGNSMSSNYSYHGHRLVPPHQPHGHPIGGGNNATEHFNRSHQNRSQPSGMIEPDPKRPRFDRQYQTGGRHSPTPHALTTHHTDMTNRTHRYDASSSHFGPTDSASRHTNTQPGPISGRPHDYRIPQPPGYPAVPSKPAGREEPRSAPRGSTNNPTRITSKPTAHQPTGGGGGGRPMSNMKHDFTDYF